MKIYTASGWPFRQDTSKINERLNGLGFNVISTWIEEETGINTPTDYGKDALRDINQVTSCDVLLAIMDDDKYAYRGTNCEIGAALALKKKIIIVCQGLGLEKQISETKYEYPYYCMNNVFFWHPKIIRVKTLDDAIIHLNKEMNNMKNMVTGIYIN